MTSSDPALTIGKWTAAMLGLAAVLRIVWGGLRALVHAGDLILEMRLVLELQREQAARLEQAAHKAEATAVKTQELAAQVAANVKRLDRLERAMSEHDGKLVEAVLISPFPPSGDSGTGTEG